MTGREVVAALEAETRQKAVCERVADAYSRIAESVEIGDAEAESIARAAWAARDARDAFVLASSDKLVELLTEAPAPEQAAA